MKFKFFFLSVMGLLLVGFISCSNKSKRSRKPVAKINFYPRNNTYRFGDSMSVKVQIKIINGDLKDSRLYLDNELVESSNQIEYSYSIPNLDKLGKHNVKVLVTKKDGVQGVAFSSFTVVSDVVPEQYTYQVVKTFPHKTTHFTQGLEIHQNEFYESTGEKGKSGIYRFDLSTGSITQSFKMEDQYFGEGITILDDKIYQLTYKAQKGFVYDLNTFARIDSFTYETAEGWGLTHNNEYLIKTDGSEFLHFINPETFEVVHKLQVYDNKGPVKLLNELEYHKGKLYANIWRTNQVVRIDPKTGKILAIIDFSDLLSLLYLSSKPIDVLNGIAIHPDNEKMYVTGKLWPKIFEVKLIKKD